MEPNGRRNPIVPCLAAAAISAIMIAGTEAVVGYPRPSEWALQFFNWSALTYAPLLFVFALGLRLVSPDQALDLWFPLLLGVLRLGTTGGRWLFLALGVLLLVIVFRVVSRKAPGPPFLFGLTVGVVLPILAGRLVAMRFGSRFADNATALAAGTWFGCVAFLPLRAFVARYPRVGPVFLLGPVVTLLIWNRESRTPASLGTTPSDSARRPDIVVIVLDTVRADALSRKDGASVMPGLSRFADGATTFTRAWTTASWTLPAHASLFSGLYLSHHLYDSGFAASDRAKSSTFLAERLRQSGYATGAFVSNFGVFSREEPLLAGFDEILAEPLRPIGFDPWLFGLLRVTTRAPWLETQRARFAAPSVRAPRLVDRALSFWRNTSGRPRFLFVNLMEAHLPWIPEVPDLGRFGPRGLETEREQVESLGTTLKDISPSAEDAVRLRARYRESIASLDRSVARLLDGLENDGVHKPIVVVTADHGESLGEHARWGHRNSLDEEATRIPLVIRATDLAIGATDAPVQLVDVHDFILRAASISALEVSDGLPIGERRSVVLEHRPGSQGALPKSYPRGDIAALIEWPFKFAEGDAVRPSLFDLSTDPGEAKDLLQEQPQRAGDMQARLRTLASSRSNGALAEKSRGAEERLRALGYVR